MERWCQFFFLFQSGESRRPDFIRGRSMLEPMVEPAIEVSFPAIAPMKVIGSWNEVFFSGSFGPACRHHVDLFVVDVEIGDHGL